MTQGQPDPAGVETRRRARVRDVLQRLYYLCSSFLVDPVRIARAWRALPYFLRNAIIYRRRNQTPTLKLRVGELLFATSDRFAGAASLRGHYFLQDLWAARQIHQRGVRHHVDVGSRIDGFVAHILPFCEVTYVDIRPLASAVDGLTFRQSSITHLPFADGTVESLSCLHVIEHIGLGRYGDPVDPDGHRRAAAELTRVLRPGGVLLVGTPVGRERLCFDAHRVFDPETVVNTFRGLELRRFALIDDAGVAIRLGASFASARECVYGCGLFVFEKPSPEEAPDLSAAL